MMSKNKDKLIDLVIDGFQKYKGKASCYCFTKSIVPELVYNVIYRFIGKRDKSNIFIIVDSYNTRKAIMDIISNNLNLPDTHNIKCLSVEYIKQQYIYSYDLIITVGVNDDLNVIIKLAKENKFMLSILTKNIMDSHFINSVRAILPCIDTAVFDNAIKTDYVYSPVEEFRYGVELSDDDRELYDKYTDYINTCVSVFGDLSNIEKCKKGDSVLGISAADFRNTIATENGWRDDLDTSIPFMRQIDDVYNPNVLFERACNFYTIARQRRDLACDNDAKLEIIKNICLENKDKRILIISKRGEYAAKITKYLKSETDLKCGDYHDCLDDCIAIDDNTGFPILVKSGTNKGKPKVIGSQAQSTLNEARFNAGIINVLSIKSASNVKLKIACDMVIFTSPICDSIIDVKTRFYNIEFVGIPTITYKIYCLNTIEHSVMNKEKINSLINVIDKTENNITYDENLGSIIL